MKISFDFDGTLTRKDVQEIARKYVDAGYDVWITTLRPDDDVLNAELLRIAKALNIPKSKHQFTNGLFKWPWLNTFYMHYDDDEFEISLIEERTNCIGMLV